MEREQLRDLLKARPFRPLRLFVTDGASYDIHHPELCVVGRRDVFIGIAPPGQSEPVHERFAHVDLIHITRAEPLDLPASTPPNGQ